MTECNICVEKFNKLTQKKVACMYCSYEACRKCWETFILSEPVAKCMNRDCTKEWTRKYLKDNFTNVFINGRLKEHKEEVLYSLEKSLLPATQIIVAREKREELFADKSKKIRDSYSGEFEECNVRFYEELERLREKREAERQEIHNKINNELEKLQVELEIDHISVSNEKKSTTKFVRACPDESCRGYLSTHWKCGLCNKWTCQECHEIIGHVKNDESHPHVCNPDAVATAKLIMNDTRPCPKCKYGIYKIDGCNQMFCTQCNTSFNWKTGEIFTRNIHNPHYFEWLEKSGGQAARQAEQNGECGQVDMVAVFSRIARLVHNNILNQRTWNYICPEGDKIGLTSRLQSMCFNLNHMRFEIMPKYETNSILQNEKYRKMFLRNEINEATFKRVLQQENKKSLKYEEIRNVLDLFVNAASDIVIRFSHHIHEKYNYYVENPSVDVDCSILNETYPLIDYVNNSLNDISTAYNSVCHRIRNDCGWL